MSSPTIKTEQQIALMRKSGQILAEIHETLQTLAVPGVSTAYLDNIAETMICEAGAIPSFKGVQGKIPFPATICACIDHQVVHGIPSKQQILQKGQILTVDLGVCYQGYHTDSATTYGIGEILPSTETFIEDCRQILYQAISILKPGITTGDIGHLIEKQTKQANYFVIHDLIGHGIGTKLHEPPQVPNFGKPKTGTTLQAGMTICIEPIIGQKTSKIIEEKDLWTLSTYNQTLSCQQEHTILITPTGYEILTLRNNEKHLAI